MDLLMLAIAVPIIAFLTIFLVLGALYYFAPELLKAFLNGFQKEPVIYQKQERQIEEDYQPQEEQSYQQPVVHQRRRFR